MPVFLSQMAFPDQMRRGLFRHASRQPSPDKAAFTKNRTHPRRNIDAFLGRKTETKATGSDARISSAWSKREESDPLVRLLTKECAGSTRVKPLPEGDRPVLAA